MTRSYDVIVIGSATAGQTAAYDLRKSGKKSFAKQLSWPTYKRVGMRDAAYKILVGEADGRLLGAHILSDNSTGLVGSFALAMKNDIPADVLHQQSTLMPYPSRESDIESDMLYMLKSLITDSSE